MQWNDIGLANIPTINPQQVTNSVAIDGLAALDNFAKQLAAKEQMNKVQAVANSTPVQQGLAYMNANTPIPTSGLATTENVMPVSTPKNTKGMSRAERNRANFNYGNAKNVDGTDKVFATPEEGTAYIADRIGRYYTDPNRKARTLLDFTRIYAPDSDGNDSTGYAKFLAKNMSKALGRKVSINENIDFLDENVVASMLPAIITMEHGHGKVSLTPEQIQAASRLGLAKYKNRS